MIYKVYAKNEIEIDKKDVLRYAFSKNLKESGEYSAVLEKCIKSAPDFLEPKTLWEYFPISFEGENTINFGSFKACSTSLFKNMKGAVGAVIFAATLGYKSERELMKAKTDAVSLLFTDAIATSVLEKISDSAFKSLKEEFSREGKFLRPRFSPGYGDFSLAHQKDIFALLDLQRRLGMTLTENLFMIPSKSITAVCAVSLTDESCEIGGCEMCDKKDICSFSRTLS